MASCHFCLISYTPVWIILEIEGGGPWTLKIFLGCLFPLQPCPIGFLSYVWGGQRLSWHPGLWAWFLPSSFPSGSWAPRFHGHCNHGWLWPSHPQYASPFFISMRPHTRGLYLGKEVVDALQEPHELLMPWSVVLPGWQKSSMRTSACECEAAPKHLWGASEMWIAKSVS